MNLWKSGGLIFYARWGMDRRGEAKLLLRENIKTEKLRPSLHSIINTVRLVVVDKLVCMVLPLFEYSLNRNT